MAVVITFNLSPNGNNIIYNFIPFFTSYNQFMYNVKNMAQPPDEPAGVAENGGQFAISRETDKAASC